MFRRSALLLYMLRVPILMLLLLWPILPLAFHSPMLRGLGDLAPNQIWFVSFEAFLLLSTAITTAFLVILYGPARADGARRPGPHPQVPPWAVVVLYAVAVFCYALFLESVYRFMRSADPASAYTAGKFAWQASVGFLAAGLVVTAVFLLFLWISEPTDSLESRVFALPAALLLPKAVWANRRIQALNTRQPFWKPIAKGAASRSGRVSLFLVRIFGPGYGSFDENGEPVEMFPGLRFAGILLLVSFAVYVLTGRGVYARLLHPDPTAHASSMNSALGYVLVLLVLWCWLLTSLTFFIDRFRAPVLAALGLILFVLSFAGAPDYTYDTQDRMPPPGSALPTPKEAFDRAPDRVIAVAAAGGGIQAAAWTSQVLCGLRAQIGPEFEKSVVVISSVSGGSVGTMFYLRCLETNEKDMKPAGWARQSSLEAVAWGLTHADLRRVLLPLSGAWWSHADRGWALEKAVWDNANFPRENMALASSGRKPRWPVLLLNSTESETGDPMVFTNSDFPSEPVGAAGLHALRSFHRRYEGRDVRLETAVRMSAAFPYISPVAKTDLPNSGMHLADGGYFDNSGIFTLAQWLKQATPRTAAGSLPVTAGASPKRILVLQIDAFPDWRDSAAEKSENWFYQLLAPLSTILHVRSESQVVRDSTESEDLLEILSGRGYESTWVTFRFEPEIATRDLPADYRASCPESPPLSWHLTPLEQACIEANWRATGSILSEQVENFLRPAVTPKATVAKLMELKAISKELPWKPPLGVYVQRASPK